MLRADAHEEFQARGFAEATAFANVFARGHCGQKFHILIEDVDPRLPYDAGEIDGQGFFRDGDVAGHDATSLAACALIGAYTLLNSLTVMGREATRYWPARLM